MIGDRVMYATRPMVIDGISVGGGSVHSSSENWVPVDSVEGIPVTKDILKRNGFRYVDTQPASTKVMLDHYVLDGEYPCRDVHVAMYSGLDTFGIIVGVNRVEREYGLRYVHELQHALRMIGFDKEIQL